MSKSPMEVMLDGLEYTPCEVKDRNSDLPYKCQPITMMCKID